MCLRVLKIVGKALDDVLDEDYKLPRTQKNYKGGEVEEMDLTSLLSAAQASGDDSTQRFSLLSESKGNCDVYTLFVLLFSYVFIMTSSIFIFISNCLLSIYRSIDLYLYLLIFML